MTPLTPQQQDAAAHRELRERGTDETRIAELDATWDSHVIEQRAIARGTKPFCDRGHDVFVNEEGIVPTCDICDGPQYAEGDNWNGETGNHYFCEDPKAEDFDAVLRRMFDLDPNEPTPEEY